MTNLFALLGVGPSVGGDDLRRAFRDKARHAHPDRGGRREDFETLRDAYNTLRDPVRRTEYERVLASYLQDRGAVLCLRCGEANRVPPGVSLRCHTCRAELPTRAATLRDRVSEAGDTFRRRGMALSDHAAQQLGQVGDRVVGEVSSLLVDGLDAGFSALRRRLRIDRRGRG